MVLTAIVLATSIALQGLSQSPARIPDEKSLPQTEAASKKRSRATPILPKNPIAPKKQPADEEEAKAKLAAKPVTAPPMHWWQSNQQSSWWKPNSQKPADWNALKFSSNEMVARHQKELSQKLTLAAWKNPYLTRSSKTHAPRSQFKKGWDLLKKRSMTADVVKQPSLSTEEKRKNGKLSTSLKSVKPSGTTDLIGNR
jgi:hypothetical protein